MVDRASLRPFVVAVAMNVNRLCSFLPFDFVAFRKQGQFHISSQRNGDQNFGARIDKGEANVFVLRLIKCSIARTENVIALATEDGVGTVKVAGQLRALFVFNVVNKHSIGGSGFIGGSCVGKPA